MGYIGLFLFVIGSILVIISFAKYGGGLIFLGLLIAPFTLAAIINLIEWLSDLPNTIKEKRRREPQGTPKQARANTAGEIIPKKQEVIKNLADSGRLDKEDAKRVVEFIMVHPSGCSLGTIHSELLDHKDLILKRYGIPGAASRYSFILGVYQNAGLLTEQQMIQYRDSFVREIQEQIKTNRP